MLDKIEKYRILGEIGQGGMSTVYLGRDDGLDRDVAVKVMHPHLARDPGARERFSREARAVARLAHPNIPKIFDYSAQDDTLNYLVTEFIDGAPLSDLLVEGAEMLPEVGAIVVVLVARALEHAHAHQIIHRDVKPENILIGHDGAVKLTDFGIAQIVGLESMTITGTLVGSPAHMSPEQILGNDDLDFRSDIWGLGTVLYGCTTAGRLPFDGPSPPAILKRIVDGKFTEARRVNPHVDSDLNAIINRCLKTDRDERYNSIGELADALETWLFERDIQVERALISDWMADREAMQEDLSSRLVATLLDRAAQASDRGEAHVALEAYDRILALSPEHPEAIRRVRELSRGLRLRRNLRRGLAGLALGLGILGLAAAAIMLPEPVDATGPAGRALQAVSVPPAAPTFQRLAPPPSADVAIMQPKTTPNEAAKAESSKRPTTPGSRTVQRTRAVRKAPRAAAAARVVLTVSPPAVKLRVDGRQVATGRPLTLTPGAHVAELTHPQCADCGVTRRRIQIPKSAAGRTIKRHLKFAFEPAKLTVICREGEVSVDGKVYGSCGKTYKIPVHSPTPKTVRVKVRLENGSVKQRSYSLKRGGVIRWTLP